jgi:hypothetical protein
MVTLYTAIGCYKLDNHGVPTVVAGNRNHKLDTYELLLWSSLAFRILTYQELRAQFYQTERELHILGELDFDHYLNRLCTRRLVAFGTDYTGVDALYDLIGHLHVQSLPNGITMKTASFMKLLLYRRLSFKKAAHIFHSEKLEPAEKHVISLIRHQTLSTAELILCAENGKKSLRNPDELMDCIYTDDSTDCESIITDGRMSETRFPILTAVASLYFKQRIMFQIV